MTGFRDDALSRVDVALLMIGHTTAPKSALPSHRAVGNVDRWEANVIQPLHAQATLTGGELVTFLCGSPSLEVAQPICARWHNVSGTVVCVTLHGEGGSRPRPPPKRIFSMGMMSAVDFPDQYSRMHGCFAAAKRHERPRAGGGRPFSHVIRARPDLLWLSPLPPLALLPTEHVALRARALVYPTPTAVPIAALSTSLACDAAFFFLAMGSNEMGSVPEHTTTDTAAATAATTAAAAERTRGRLLAPLRARMAAAGVAACYVPDDQFAIMPRHLAESYFELESPGALSAASLRQHTPTAHTVPGRARTNCVECSVRTLTAVS
jgi:hypothetical protein